MSGRRCAVPNCKNTATTGISFPNQKELLEKWLHSLKIPNFVPSVGSFVCLDHFREDENSERNTETNLQNLLENLPIPVIALKVEDGIKKPIWQKQSEAEENRSDFTFCRLCMGLEITKHIFDRTEDNRLIADLIRHCIPSIKPSEKDQISQWICQLCLNKLEEFDSFHNTCLLNDKKQRNMLKPPPKRTKTIKDSVYNVKRICTELSKSHTDLPLSSNRQFVNVEAELMKALEGKLPEEMIAADNIIIEIQSDDESEQAIEATITEDNTVRVGEDEVKLPKGIRVSVNQAKEEVHDAKGIEIIYNSEFCLVNNYVFEYRLCKGGVRQLRCLAPKCNCIAQQNMISPGIFENTVLIKMIHNHPAPTPAERKKHIFLHLMRRRMQSDTGLNFKNVYEEFCEKDPEIRRLVPLKTVINKICCQQMNQTSPPILSFHQFYSLIENDEFQRLQFTQSNVQFYQEKFTSCDGAEAVIFGNCNTIDQKSDSKIMYVDASFKIDTQETFDYHLVSVLVWVTDSFYPIMFALISEKTLEIYKIIFTYLRDKLAPKLKPEEIVTDYEAALYYSLGEIYINSHIGGSVFYYTQNMYKKICSLNLSRELETNSCFRSIYHMILMLPLLPVNTILDGLTNIELQAAEMGQAELAHPIFEYVKSQWIDKVTPELFCVHRLENRINENVIAPFKKLRDLIMLSKGKLQKQPINILSIVEKLIDLEGYLISVYSAPYKKSFARDISTSQKKNVIRAWQFIESHPKININHFFNKVLGYIKCMENQLWIWGFYRYSGEANDELINVENFSIVNTTEDDDHNYGGSAHYVSYVCPENGVVDVIIDQKDGFLKEVRPEDIQAEIIETQVNTDFQDSYIE